MIHGYNLVNKIDTGETYEKEFEFTKDLIRNQKWKVEKIDWKKYKKMGNIGEGYFAELGSEITHFWYA